jgi:hypothetical protein
MELKCALNSSIQSNFSGWSGKKYEISYWYCLVTEDAQFFVFDPSVCWNAVHSSNLQVFL